jgi:hypothetical protein
MDNQAFDQALMREAFDLAGEVGWPRMRIAEAARRAGLPLERARRRMPGKIALLLLLGRTADESALAQAMTEGSPRDRLFDLLMQRLEIFQAHRAGVRALLRALPAEPPLALLLGAATRRSMGWMLEAAGVPSGGPRGCLRVQGLMGVWLWAVRAWARDDTPDLSSTMSALDSALGRAERAAGWLEGRRTSPATDPDEDDLARDDLAAGAPDGDDPGTDLDPIAS